jgi:hypothetical protein
VLLRSLSNKQSDCVHKVPTLLPFAHRMKDFFQRRIRVPWRTIGGSISFKKSGTTIVRGSLIWIWDRAHRVLSPCLVSFRFVKTRSSRRACVVFVVLRFGGDEDDGQGRQFVWIFAQDVAAAVDSSLEECYGLSWRHRHSFSSFPAIPMDKGPIECPTTRRGEEVIQVIY